MAVAGFGDFLEGGQDGVLFEVGIVFSLCHAKVQALLYTFNTPPFPFLFIVLGYFGDSISCSPFFYWGTAYGVTLF